MDTYECVRTKLDVREFSSKDVPSDVKMKVLESARLTGSGINSQHWRFIIVQDKGRLAKLADDSTTGQWAKNANFAVIVLTNPKYGFHLLDAGRAVQDMQLTAWDFGVTSCIFTGFKEEALRKDFNIPKTLHPSVVVAFGYPPRKLSGKKKNRKPLSELAFLDSYGTPLTP